MCRSVWRLTDRRPRKEQDQMACAAADLGSGRFDAAYELVDPACFVIDKDGRLVFALIEGEEEVESFRIGSATGLPPPFISSGIRAMFGPARPIMKMQRIDFAATEIDRASARAARATERP